MKKKNQLELKTHWNNLHNQQNQNLNKELKETQKRKDYIENEYKMCEEELRKKQRNWKNVR